MRLALFDLDKEKAGTRVYREESVQKRAEGEGEGDLEREPTESEERVSGKINFDHPNGQAAARAGLGPMVPSFLFLFFLSNIRRNGFSKARAQREGRVEETSKGGCGTKNNSSERFNVSTISERYIKSVYSMYLLMIS